MRAELTRGASNEQVVVLRAWASMGGDGADLEAAAEEVQRSLGSAYDTAFQPLALVIALGM